MRKLFIPLLALVCAVGCTVVSANRTFPKLDWYWSKDAQMQRDSAKELDYFHKTGRWHWETNSATRQTLLYPGADKEMTPLALKIQKRDGTNFLGQYMGMIAEFGEAQGVLPKGVMMFSATSGECLKWISAKDFTNIFVLKTQKEYP